MFCLSSCSCHSYHHIIIVIFISPVAVVLSCHILFVVPTLSWISSFCGVPSLMFFVFIFVVSFFYTFVCASKCTDLSFINFKMCFVSESFTSIRLLAFTPVIVDFPPVDSSLTVLRFLVSSASLLLDRVPINTHWSFQKEDEVGGRISLVRYGVLLP